jgi:hypothetical protein
MDINRLGGSSSKTMGPLNSFLLPESKPSSSSLYNYTELINNLYKNPHPVKFNPVVSATV